MSALARAYMHPGPFQPDSHSRNQNMQNIQRISFCQSRSAFGERRPAYVQIHVDGSKLVPGQSPLEEGPCLTRRW